MIVEHWRHVHDRNSWDMFRDLPKVSYTPPLVSKSIAYCIFLLSIYSNYKRNNVVYSLFRKYCPIHHIYKTNTQYSNAMDENGYLI